MTASVDEHCSLDDGLLFKDFHCLLNQVDEKSNKFYLIQLLTNDKGYFVWTRWGKNGTTGQTKLEGPTKQLDAETIFKKKFQDKTKNKWEDKDNFVAVTGKYTMVNEAGKCATSDTQQSGTEHSASLEEEKPCFPDTVVSGKTLPADILYHIMSYLPTKDVLRCMQVCKFWKLLLSEKYIWRKLIRGHFDLTLMSDVKGEHPFGEWSDPNEWFCYYDNEDDAYVIRPFPSMWKCGVIHPFGLDPMSGDVRSLQGFCRSLEILTHMRQELKALPIASGYQCSASEGGDSICVVLFPWDEDELPGATQILTQIFHFHPEIFTDYIGGSHQGERRGQKLYYHLPQEDKDEDEDEDDDDDDPEEHDIEEKPCLNRIFGFGGHGEEGIMDRAREFYAWLQNIMVPTITVYAGSDKLNPVAVFFLTKLAPGWVGGALTAVIYT